MSGRPSDGTLARLGGIFAILGCSLIVLLTHASVATAEVLAVRSGEHAGFSRIVIAPAKKTRWRLGRVGAGYELRLDRPGVTFDMSRAFDLIPKRRLSALSEGTVDSSLAFGLACDCHAVGFETAGGAIVVDIAAGPANPDSGFEAQLDPAPAPPEDTMRGEWVQSGGRLGIQAAAPSGRQWPNAHFPFDPGPPGLQLAISDPGHFWKRRLATASGESPSGSEGNRTPAADHGPAPDLRISNTEQELLFQLGRAATQGLVETRDPNARPPTEPAGKAETPDEAPHTPEAPIEPASDRAAVRSETSIDRDTVHMRIPGESMTADGEKCAPDSEFDAAAWGDDTNPVDQMVEARAALVGEFDTPDQVAVVDLVRLYLRYGFGAEGRAILDAFAVPDDQAAYLRDLTFLVDGDALPAPSRIRDQTGCDSAVALWALLAAGMAEKADSPSRSAALRAFAALPPTLRQTVGPRLADIFLAAGAAGAARSVRDATDRASAGQERAIHLIDARIDLSEGDGQTAEDLLDRLSTGNDPTAQDALVLGIETHLARGGTVDPLLTDAAEALAHENRGTPQGGRLARAHALALAANGAYDAAFDALAASEDIPDDARRAADLLILARIVETASDGDFLAQMSLNLPRFAQEMPDPGLQLRLADRLITTGLPDLVEGALSADTSATMPGRLLRARAALADFDPASALQILADLGGSDAVLLRARAYELVGNDRAAADGYAAAGQTRDSASAAMRAHDWARAAALGDDTVRQHLRDLGLIPASADPEPAPAALPAKADTGQPAAASPAAASAAPGAGQVPAGPIAAAKDLVDRSRATRAAVESLLSSQQ